MESMDYPFEVKWGDTDAAGIVFFPNFYKWMNEATHHFFKKIGHDCATLLREEKISVPLLEAKCQFKTPLFFEDQVTIHSTIREVRNKVIIIDHVFERDSEKIAEGYEIRAWTSFEGKPKAVLIPDNVREALGVQVSSINKV